MVSWFSCIQQIIPGIVDFFFFYVGFRAKEMSLELREFAAIAEDPGSVPSTHTVTHNHHYGLQGIGNLTPPSRFPGPQAWARGAYTHMRSKRSYT